MKSLKYISTLLIIASITLFTGCSKSFLDDPKPSDKVPVKDAFETTQGTRAYMNGIYRSIRSQWQNIDETAGGSTDTWGIVSINLAREAKADDVVMPLQNNWYIFDYLLDNREPIYRRVVFTWFFFYEIINQTNVVIDGVGKSNFTEDNKNLFIAEARALRAWCYFELVREFQNTYLANPNAPGIPIYTAPTDIHTVGQPRGTVKQVFDQINSDLDFAVQYLDSYQQLKSNINVNVAYGLKARVALEQGLWQDAITAAQSARVGFSLHPDQYANGFNDMDKSQEWMWGFPNALTGGQSLYYGIPSSFWEKTGNGYDNYYINETLVSFFSETDVRNLFVDNGVGLGPERFYTTKFGLSTNFDDDLPMMRASEMILIEAEAKAHLGQADAGDVLFVLQSNRDPNAVKSGNTGQDLINEIAIERRKELYGEIGINFLDIKRLQLPLTRSGNHDPGVMYDIPANDPAFILKIPQRELDANPNINDGDQNP